MPRAKQPSVANNRTDLLTPSGPKRVMTSPGQEQGKQTAQEQSQAILPIGTPQVAGAAPPPPAAGPAPAPAPQGPLPGALPWLHPSNRPNEPITHGMPQGPGAGPEVLQGVGAAAYASQTDGGTVRNVLGNLAAQPGASSAVKALLAHA